MDRPVAGFAHRLLMGPRFEAGTDARMAVAAHLLGRQLVHRGLMFVPFDVAVAHLAGKEFVFFRHHVGLLVALLARLRSLGSGEHAPTERQSCHAREARKTPKLEAPTSWLPGSAWGHGWSN